jgi:hypothetical protein
MLQRVSEEGRWNRRVGWTSLAVGVGTGLVMGLWSFDGPVAVPEWLGAYGATSRRLARLGHIAFIGLGILDVLLARELAHLALSPAAKRLAARLMVVGNVLLPPALFAAAASPSMKYALPPGALAVFLSLVLAARGAWRSRDA